MFSRIKKQRLWLNFGDAINPLLNCENLIKRTTLFSLQFTHSANQRLTLLNKTKNVGKRIFDKKRRQNVHLRKKHRQKYIWEKGLPHDTAGKVSVFGVFSVRIYQHSDNISPYSVWMRENTDKKNSEYGHFSRSATLYLETRNFA